MKIGRRGGAKRLAREALEQPFAGGSVVDECGASVEFQWRGAAGALHYVTKVDLCEWRHLVGQHKSEIAGRILLFHVGDEILRALIEVQELSGKFRRESRRGRLRRTAAGKKNGERKGYGNFVFFHHFAAW